MAKLRNRKDADDKWRKRDLRLAQDKWGVELPLEVQKI